MTEEELFSHIQTQYDSQLPFVAYRKPKETLVKAILQSDTTQHLVTDFTESGFIFSPFDTQNDTLIFPSESCKTITSQCFISSEIEPINLKHKVDAKARQQHIDLVKQGIKYIKTGHLKKVVLSRIEVVPLSEDQPIAIFKSLLSAYQTAFVYIWYHPKVGLWLGATPETLLDIDGRRFRTMSLAGTKPYKEDKELSWGIKEINEQQIVTEYIVNHIHDSVSDIKATEPKTIRAGQLLHLQSKISGDLKAGQLQSVIKSLHPTPAICGLPKAEAKKFILKNEQYHREFYTGFLGELNLRTSKSRNTNRRNVENNAYSTIKRSSELFVNLRCVQLKNKQAIIYVGGGITQASNPELEWEETVNKTQTIRRVLA
ncbi:MAG: chorismate-binding protein [Psychroserpens sp.]|uniref:chorismate-binding protein n=1 Tax=Psychroserpens sp. TaxID=2020870 RepID=UPI003C8EB24A